MDNDSWATVQWTSYPRKDDASATAAAWRKQRVPYIPQANALQTLDIWVPEAADKAASSRQAPPAASMPAQKGIWIVYVHGGAWRDPAITASSFSPTVDHLLAQQAAPIGGLASLSYSLSEHPSHPSDPSPPADPSQPRDPSREAVHPTHILDVITGLCFLQAKAGFGENYILIGHSCGATLALQAAMDDAQWAADQASFKKPKVIVGLNGLYDLPALIADPGPKHEQLVKVYEAFTRQAFGDDVKDWRRVSPTSVGDWSAEWRNGTMIVLAQSHEDSLVPYRQTEGMLAAFKKSCGKSLQVREVDVTGDHNEIWQQGKRLAEILMEIVREQAV